MYKCEWTIYRNNGTLTNGPIYSSADGGSIVFDGSNDYVSSNVGTILDIGTSVSITYSAWIKYSTSASNYTGIIAKAVAASSGNTGFQMLLYANKLSCEVALAGSILVGPLTGLLGTTLLNTGKWFNIVLTINRSTNTVSIYVNGVLESSQTNAAISTSNLTSTSNLLIATERTSALFLNGNISQALIYNKALSQAEVLQNYNAQKARYQAIAAQFSPLQLSPALWLDASDATTLYDATVGGNFVAADGVVARWEDKSGNARHATQATLANRPQRKIGVKNGKDIIRFNGSNFLTTANVATTSTSYTIITVSSTTNLSSPQCIAYNGLAASNGFGHFCYQSNATVVHGSISIIQDGSLNTSAEIWSSVRESNSLNFWRNGNLQLTSTVSVIQPTGKVHIGDTELNNAPLIGDIIEIYIFSSPLTTDNRKNLERYLGAKYGITVS